MDDHWSLIRWSFIITFFLVAGSVPCYHCSFPWAVPRWRRGGETTASSLFLQVNLPFPTSSTFNLTYCYYYCHVHSQLKMYIHVQMSFSARPLNKILSSGFLTGPGWTRYSDVIRSIRQQWISKAKIEKQRWNAERYLRCWSSLRSQARRTWDRSWVRSMREDPVVRESPGWSCQAFLGFAKSPPPHFFYFLGRLNELIKDIGLMTLVMRVSWNSKRDLVSLDKINDFHTFLTLFPDQGFVFINELSLNWSDKGRAGFPPENNRPLWPLVQQHDVQVCLKIISTCVKFGQRTEICGREMFQKRRWKKTKNTHPPVFIQNCKVKQTNIFG